jgi:hypothetical protein
MQPDAASPDTSEMARGPLRKPLLPGEIGVLLADAGVGKTACLTQIALEQLLRGLPVLHVCIDEAPEKVKVWYQELLKGMTSDKPEKSLSSLQRSIEPHRFILAYLHKTFNPEKLEHSLQNLKDQAGFKPTMVVLDGLDFDQAPRSTVEALKKFAEAHTLSLWMSARTHRHIPTVNERGIPYPCNEIDDLLDAIVLLKSVPPAIHLSVLKFGGRYRPDFPEVLISPQTFLELKDAAPAQR